MVYWFSHQIDGNSSLCCCRSLVRFAWPSWPKLHPVNLECVFQICWLMCVEFGSKCQSRSEVASRFLRSISWNPVKESEGFRIRFECVIFLKCKMYLFRFLIPKLTEYAKCRIDEHVLLLQINAELQQLQGMIVVGKSLKIEKINDKQFEFLSFECTFILLWLALFRTHTLLRLTTRSQISMATFAFNSILISSNMNTIYRCCMWSTPRCASIVTKLIFLSKYFVKTLMLTFPSETPLNINSILLTHQNTCSMKWDSKIQFWNGNSLNNFTATHRKSMSSWVFSKISSKRRVNSVRETPFIDTGTAPLAPS